MSIDQVTVAVAHPTSPTMTSDPPLTSPPPHHTHERHQHAQEVGHRRQTKKVHETTKLRLGYRTRAPKAPPTPSMTGSTAAPSACAPLSGPGGLDATADGAGVYEVLGSGGV